MTNGNNPFPGNSTQDRARMTCHRPLSTNRKLRSICLHWGYKRERQSCNGHTLCGGATLLAHSAKTCDSLTYFLCSVSCYYYSIKMVSTFFIQPRSKIIITVYRCQNCIDSIWSFLFKTYHNLSFEPKFILLYYSKTSWF